jgi:hypothetical protein
MRPIPLAFALNAATTNLAVALLLLGADAPTRQGAQLRRISPRIIDAIRRHIDEPDFKHLTAGSIPMYTAGL